MYRRLEAAGTKLLGLFVPNVEAAAYNCEKGSWSACWQCNWNYTQDGHCGYNAPCDGTVCSDGTYILNCHC